MSVARKKPNLDVAALRTAELAALCDAFACIGESNQNPEKETMRYLGYLGVRLAKELSDAIDPV